MNLFTKTKYKDIDPDEIFIDSENLPEFNTDQFEGRIEKPISKHVFLLLSIAFVSIGFVFLGRLWNLEVISGGQYKTKSENIRLKNETIFTNRGIIFDRNGESLAWNDLNPNSPDFPLRVYATSTGISTVLGYVAYPAKDSSGNYYQKDFIGKDGVEKTYNYLLSGVNGMRLTETNVLGQVTSQSILVPPQDGQNVTLSIDRGIQSKLYQTMLDFSARAGYQGGAAVMMDVSTGEMIALTNFPEYNSNVMSSADDTAKIKAYLSDKNNPFLNRAISGLYTPGSIMKPFIAMGALNEGVIDPNKQILSTGSISVPNPYDKTKPSIFKDWKALGWVDMRHALAMSSDVYFYEVGGGFQSPGQPAQAGLGITNIEKYLRLFGFGSKSDIDMSGESLGIIPDPVWKKINFNNEDWRLGDTYNTAIGQYGLQITPLQAVRGIAAIANDGDVLTPTIIKTGSISKATDRHIDLNPEYLNIVKDGMRLAVTDGTAKTLNVPYVNISAKTGTAELGVTKARVNSWVIGFFPTEHPRYAFAVVMEKGAANNQIGATLIMRQVLDWMSIYKSDYFK